MFVWSAKNNVPNLIVSVPWLNALSDNLLHLHRLFSEETNALQEFLKHGGAEKLWSIQEHFRGKKIKGTQ